MNLLKILSNNKTLYSLITIIILIGVVGIIGNSLIKNKISSWNEESIDEVAKTKIVIEKFIQNTQDQIETKKRKIVQVLSSVQKNTFKDFHSEIEKFNNINLRLSIYKDDVLFYWNDNYLDQNSFRNNTEFKFGETFFIQSDINSYVAIRDTFTANNEVFVLFISEIVEKEYQLNLDYFNSISLIDQIREVIGTELQIEFTSAAKKTKDGRKYSFELKNNRENIVGIATFLKPTRESAVQKVESIIFNIQGVLALLGYLILGLLLIKTNRKNKKRLVKFIFIALYLIVLRYILIFLKFPANLFTNEIFDDSFYFSQFGKGLAYSPIELMITLLFFFIISFYSFKYILEYFNSDDSIKNRSSIISLLTILIGILVYVISLRGIGASIRGFVFDTTLRYFQNTSLYLSSPHFIMHVNVLLVGLISITGSATIIIAIFTSLKKSNKLWDFKKVITIVLLLLFALFIYHFQQNNPQLTILLKILQILLVFIVLYFVIDRNTQTVSKTILIFLSASIFSIGSLLFYNTELERASLKATANIVSRYDDTWYKTLITETLLADFSRDEAEFAFTNKNSNFNSSAFKIWSNSQLQKEAINSSVNFINLSGELEGGFGSIYPSYSLNRFIDTNSVLEEIQIFEEPTGNDSQKIIRGIFPVKDEYAFIGYLDVSILSDINNFGFSSHPEFISTGKLNDKAILKLDKLIILDYRNSELVVVYGNLNPTLQLNETILNTEYSSGNDAWIETNINNAEYLIYLKRIKVNDITRVIAVALKEKELSIGLFDFFKIFFTHSLILLLIIFGYFVINYKEKILYQFDLRTKLLSAFLIISIIPLVLTALYFRNLTEGKNKDAIYYKLGKRAFSVESYINENYDENIDFEIFAKASSDLNINYSIFRQNKLEYSSHDLLYDVGLFSRQLNPAAYNEIILNESQEILLTESVDEYLFNSFFYRGSFLGEEIIIKVSDGFNRIRLPLSGSEVDVFLFGIYSLASMLIIIFSAIFANQISLPIRKITSATKSIAAGDLSVELKTQAKGELGELVSGFQYMVHELKKNQTILAEIERKEAWKEMAKQVAHEIKNPLTPMKLSVQQLVTAYNDKSEKFDHFFKKVTNTLLNQIETLKNIATEFSNFARMPGLKLETINCTDVINQSINLFTDEKVSIKLLPFDGTKFINGDSEQLKRTIINLIRNSIQAESDKIILNLNETVNTIELVIEDNGKGIPKENISKIFEANFTTKIEGMGIGLSMAKRYMNSIGGSIELIKSSGDGTEIKLTFPK